MGFNSTAVKKVSTRDKIAMAVYLIIQNRVAEATRVFNYIKKDTGRALCAGTYDYLAAYLSMFAGNFDQAVATADQYIGQPGAPQHKAKWRNLKAMAEEAVNPDLADETFNEARYAAAEEARKPSLDFACESGHKIRISYRNEKTCTIEYWKMDLEVLFSSQPFAAAADSYSWVEPNERERAVKLPEGGSELVVNIPASMRNQNSIIRITSGSGITVVRQDYDNEIEVQVGKAVGELRVLTKSGEPVSVAYVKVYSQTADGAVGFYKDGYTDLRGRFSYRDISTSKQKNTKRYAVMVMTETLGSSKIEISA